jgi:hypothetical protein
VNILMEATSLAIGDWFARRMDRRHRIECHKAQDNVKKKHAGLLKRAILTRPSTFETWKIIGMIVLSVRVCGRTFGSAENSPEGCAISFCANRAISTTDSTMSTIAVHFNLKLNWNGFHELSKLFKTLCIGIYKLSKSEDPFDSFLTVCLLPRPCPVHLLLMNVLISHFSITSVESNTTFRHKFQMTQDALLRFFFVSSTASEKSYLQTSNLIYIQMSGSRDPGSVRLPPCVKMSLADSMGCFALCLSLYL